MTQPPESQGPPNPPDGGSQSGWGQPPQQPGSQSGWSQPPPPQQPGSQSGWSQPPPPQQPGSQSGWGQPPPPQQPGSQSGWGQPPPPQQPGSQSGWGQPDPPTQPQPGQQWSPAPETQQFNLGGQPASPPPTQAQPAYQPGPYQPTGPAGGWQGGPGQGGPGQGGPRKTSRKGLIIGIAAVVVLALVGGGLFFLLSGEDITYQGRAIIEPERVLSDAESRVSEIVEERGGAENDETSCYFLLKQAEETDIADQILCGPVLFVDGDEGQSYLSFPVSASGGDDDATLTVAPDPDSDEPAEPADRALLIRPDAGTPAEGSGGLTVPEPRRAEPGFTASVDPGELDLASAGTYLGGLSASFLLTGYGEADRIGQGDEARRPAEGERFVAFSLETASPEGSESGPPELSVQADGESVGTLDDLTGGGGGVASVPADAEEVTLLIADSGIEQTVSLTTGEPGEGNIQVWQRQNRSAPVSATAVVTGVITLTTGESGPSIPLTLSIGSVSLLYAAGPIVAAGPDRALLAIDNNSVSGAGTSLNCSPGCFSLTLPDGTVVGAQDGGGYAVFDVPAAFTDGTINLNGVLVDTNGDRIDFAASGGVIPVAIPAD